MDYLDGLLETGPNDTTAELYREIKEKIMNDLWHEEGEPRPIFTKYPLGAGTNRKTISEVRSIAASEQEKEAKSKVDQSTLDQLEEEYNKSIILLQSARRTVRLWRRGMAAWLAGVVAGAALVATGVTSIVTGDFSTFWALLVSGAVLEGAAAPGAYYWVKRFRLSVKNMPTDRYSDGHTVKVPATVGYIDPKFNVELREMQYGTALRKLTHALGRDPAKGDVDAD